MRIDQGQVSHSLWYRILPKWSPSLRTLGGLVPRQRRSIRKRFILVLRAYRSHVQLCSLADFHEGIGHETRNIGLISFIILVCLRRRRRRRWQPEQQQHAACGGFSFFLRPARA